MTESVCCVVMRGNRNALNQLIAELPERGIRVVVVKFGGTNEFFLIKRLREWNEGEGAKTEPRTKK